MKKISFFLVAAALFAMGASAATKHVKPGTDSPVWAGKPDVYATIAEALADATTGDEIWVAQGEYPVSAALTWKNGVNVYGGFVGNETDKAQRSRDALLTLVSRASGATRLLAATAALETPTTWSGFTFQNSTGGGVQMHANCILDNCVVRNNTRSGTGGGILADPNAAIAADIVIQNCRIINNQASGTNAGGGIYARAAGTSTGKFILRNSVIANNRGGNNGGGVSLTSIPYEVTNSTLVKNNRGGSWPGGALYSYGGRAVITNCLFWGNVDATGYGGARNDFFLESPGAGTTITKCILTQDITSGTGYSNGEVIQYQNASDITLSDNIITSNTDNDDVKFASPSATAGYAANSAANLNADWSILSGSIAIDAGAAIDGLSADIAGRARPKFASVDVGAYEYVAALDIAATENSATDYDVATMGDVIIRANDSEGTGQWSAAAAAVTDGVVKVVKTVAADKAYAIGFPFTVSSIDKAFKTLQAYNGVTNRFEDAASIEAGKGYLVSFAAAGDVTFTSAPNPSLLTTYPEAAADYKLVPALSLQNVASISGAAKYYSYDLSTSTWGAAADAIAGDALKPFDAVIVATAANDFYASIGTGLADSKWANVAIAGEGHVTITQPAGSSPYEMGAVGATFDLKFTVGAGYVPFVTVTNSDGDVSHTLTGPEGGVYTVSHTILEATPVTITITTAKQQLDVAVTKPASGVNITLPAGGSPYKVYYDSAFVLNFTVDDPSYLPQVAVNSAPAVIPDGDDNGSYTVKLNNVKENQDISITLAAKKRVELIAGAGVTITKPAGGAAIYEAPQGGSFTYAFSVRSGYDNPQVNGLPVAAGEYAFTVNNDSTLNITATVAKWKVTLNTDGSLADDVNLAEPYPDGGYEVEHEQPLAIRFAVAGSKYPVVTPPKGVAYVLTQEQDAYTLTLPCVTEAANVALAVRDEVALPKGVVPVAEDVSSRGAGTAADVGTIFVINKGANNGNTYATHLKFDFGRLPLSALEQFPSVQLKLTTGWQANDAAGAQWMVTETADTWSEAAPFQMNNSPAPVDTVATFTFGDIHPATPTANVDIYLDLTSYLIAWLKAPERATDKTLSLRIFNTLQTAGGGEVDLKSKEDTNGDLGPKLIFGSVSTDIEDLTVGGASVYKAGQHTYTITDAVAGNKIPAVAYTLPASADERLIAASAVAYTPADTVIAAGKRNVATFTIAPIAALAGEGATHKYTVNFPLPMVIGAAETKTAAGYTSGSYSDIVFHVTDTSAAQLTVGPGPLTLGGVAKVVRTFEANRFYAVGFPFDVTPSATPAELFTYGGQQLQPARAIEKGKGYLIKFAEAGEVAFTSAPNPTLPQASTIIAASNPDSSFIANPYVSNVLYVPNASGAYYRYNSTGHYFERVPTPGNSPNPVKPFDGIIVSANRTAQYIMLGGDSKLPHNVRWTKSDGITITSGQEATAVVTHDSAYVLTFTVDDCYENVAATIANNSSYALGAPDANGVYTVRIDAVTADTAINISATIKTFGVTIAKNAGVTLTQGRDTTLSCGAPYEVKFTVAGEKIPAVTVNGALHALLAPVGGEYTVAVAATEALAISIQAAAPRLVTVSADSCVSVVSTSGLPAGADGVYETAEGNPFEVTFRLNTGYNTPQVANAALAGPDADGIYTATIGSVTRDSTVSITAAINRYAITVNANNVAQVTSPAAAPYSVEHGKAFTLEFTLNEGYEKPQVAIGDVPYAALGSGVNGAYTVVTGAITSDTAISITASLKRFGVTIASDGHVAPSIPADVKHDTTYGSPFTFTFTLNEHYANPQVTIGGALYALGNPTDGVYTVTIGAVTRDTVVRIAASPETFEVNVTAEHVTVATPAGESPHTVAYDSVFTLTFTVDEHYENPQVTVGGAPYALGDPTGSGVYAVVDTITQATDISIVALPKEYDLTLTADANVTLVSPAAAGSVPVAYGSAFVVQFRVATGYTPVLKTDGTELQIGSPDAQGIYAVTAVQQVSGEHYVAITAKEDAPSAIYREDFSDPVVRVQYYTLAGVEVAQPAVTGVYIVKRTLASKKVVVRKELITVNN